MASAAIATSQARRCSGNLVVLGETGRMTKTGYCVESRFTLARLIATHQDGAYARYKWTNRDASSRLVRPYRRGSCYTMASADSVLGRFNGCLPWIMTGGCTSRRCRE